MSLTGKRWIWPSHGNEGAELARQTGLPPALCRILANRGVTDAAAAEQFLNPSIEQLHSPYLMKGMEEAVGRISLALARREKIVIHGDYDADGITATVIMLEALRALGADVDHFLPSRFAEGYGLHIETLQSLREQGASLLVTVDCGINAVEEVAYARSIGLEVVVTDHHQPLTSLTGAAAVLNPLQQGCSYPCKFLAGAGIAFKLATALLEKHEGGFPTHLLDLAALGTIADVVPLLGENRVITACGLEQMKSLARPGIKALAKASGLDREQLGSGNVAFVLAPSINAAGRMGEAEPAAKLLMETDNCKADELAGALRRENQRRREIEQQIMKEAEEAVLADPGRVGEKVITLAGEGWHHGVIGIVASRLVERFNRPVVLIAVEEGEGRGSARSIPGFHITEALSACASLLERFGGHAQAAGLTIEASRVEDLRVELNRLASLQLQEDEMVPALKLEVELNRDELNIGLARSLSALQPFGSGNPGPVLASRDWALHSWRMVGADGKHLKLLLHKEGYTAAPMFFSGAHLQPQLFSGRRMDLAFTLKEGFYKGEAVLDIYLKDISYSDSAQRGWVEVIDRRGHGDPKAYLRELLKKRESPVAVFTATGQRQEELSKKLPNPGNIFFSGRGAAAGKAAPPPGTGDLVLIDLPLQPAQLQPFFSTPPDPGPLRVHLLYGELDKKVNETLLNMALPTSAALEQIYLSLQEGAAAGEKLEIPGPGAGLLTFRPGNSFWKRCRDIFAELGLLGEGGQGGFNGRETELPLSRLIEGSSAFKKAQLLREQCLGYQELLLTADKETLAQTWNQQIEG